MSSGQEKILEFPDDDAFWLVKWIDEFRIPHLGTRSASVGVILQKLPFTKIQDLHALRAEDLLQILGHRNKDQTVQVFRQKPVMPGILPLLYIGEIFHKKVKVGELPTRRARLGLLNGGQEGIELALGEPIQAPPGWKKERPHYLLNKYEYSTSTVFHMMPRSRCLIIKHGGITYVIPRMTIFKTFYACHTELAKAFCNGPWPERLQDVICLSDFESGLKTEAVSGQWNVILQTLVPDRFAELLALYYFDPFARACAESIYSKSLQDRGARMQEPWYATAQIPFMPSTKKLSLDVRGFQLRSWYKDKEEGGVERQKFLVTEIAGCTWPNYIPDIGYERSNSGQKGARQTWAEGSRPYKKTPQGQPSGPDTGVDSEHDADANSPATHMNAAEFSWLNPPRKHKLQKNSSKQYPDSDDPPPRPTPDNKISTGGHSHQQDTNGKGEAEITVREPEKRFDHIYEVLQSLADKKFITSMQVYPCPIHGKRIWRGSHDCWSFTDESRKHGYRPRRGWRLVEYDAEDFRNCKYRSALVIKLEINSKPHYWIEIECRSKEGGYRSPLLSNINGDATQIIAEALEIIVEKNGINLKPPLNHILGEQGVVAHCYKHIYESKDSAKLDIDSVKRFLSGR
ncbi:MAG: hypothetical protein ABI659_05655 [Nitrosospira sp.]